MKWLLFNAVAIGLLGCTAASSNAAAPRPPGAEEIALCGTIKAGPGTDSAYPGVFLLLAPGDIELIGPTPVKQRPSRLLIHNSVRESFPADLRTAYVGNRVCVTGALTTYAAGSVGVAVKSPSDVAVRVTAAKLAETATAIVKATAAKAPRAITNESGELNLSSQDFGAGWELATERLGNGDHRVTATRAGADFRDAAAYRQVVSVVRVMTADEVEARELFASVRTNVSRQAGIEDVRIGDEGFVIARGSEWQVHFRYLNVYGFVASQGILVTSGTRDEAISWAKKLDKRIRANATIEAIAP